MKTTTTPLDHATLVSLLTYRDGKLFWAETGVEAGHKVCSGRYTGVGIRRVVYRRSRIVWFYHHKEWPRFHIDHINGDGHDDRIENLRDVSIRENNCNMPVHRNGRLPGATLDKQLKTRPWFARIKINGRAKFLGQFPTELDAHLAYMKAKEAL